jgi:hypothetical protein
MNDALVVRRFERFGVIQRCEQFGFAVEACEAIGILRELARQRLDRHVAAELRVARAIDLPMPPAPMRPMIS